MPQEVRIKTNEKVTNALSVILDELNNVSASERIVIAQSIWLRIKTEHRTLQQAFWSAVLMAQIDYADTDFDPRNEQAVKLAKLVKELAVRNNMDMGLPFI